MNQPADPRSPLDVLRDEHRVILSALDALELIALRGTQTGHLVRAPARDALEFIRTFVDTCHLMKEENHLFPLVERHVPGFAPNGVLRHHHDEGRTEVVGMHRAFEQNDAERFAACAFAYVALVRQHFHSEERSLWPMIDALLTGDDREELLRAFVRIDVEDLGDGVYDRMMGRIKGLREYCGLEPCEPSVRAAPRMSSDLLLPADDDDTAPSALFAPTDPSPAARRMDSN
jgi:hemerythrin-like domain-containing protein